MNASTFKTKTGLMAIFGILTGIAGIATKTLDPVSGMQQIGASLCVLFGRDAITTEAQKAAEAQH